MAQTRKTEMNIQRKMSARMSGEDENFDFLDNFKAPSDSPTLCISVSEINEADSITHCNIPFRPSHEKMLAELCHVD